MKNSTWFMLAILAGLIWGCESPETASKTVEYFKAPVSSEFTSSEKQSFIIDTVVTGLDVPWGMAFLPNGEMLITEKRGAIRVVKNGQILADSLKGVPAVFAEGQGGLLDIKLHPDYATNGWVYFSYSCPGDSGANTAIMRAKLDGMALVEQQKLFQATPYLKAPYHFGSRIVLDKGYLYFSVGERGTKENAQTLTNHCGKIHRIYDDGRIPEDNPFKDSVGAMPEIFAYGNRNPQGMTLNPATGELWEHEHGPMGGDEVNIIRAGKNYGWPVISYGINYDGTILTEDTVKEGMEQPEHFWRPSIAPSGMTFYTGDQYPSWKNNLFVGSLKFRYLNRCEVVDGKIVHEEKLLDGMGRVRAVEQGPDGYIYVALEGPGMIIRLYPAPKATAMR